MKDDLYPSFQSYSMRCAVASASSREASRSTRCSDMSMPAEMPPDVTMAPLSIQRRCSSTRTSGNGCNGGDGGKGGQGGSGSGGAGGLSVGVLSSGAAPTTDGATFTLGTAGGGGSGTSSNDGPPGVKAPTATVEVVSTEPQL